MEIPIITIEQLPRSLPKLSRPVGIVDGKGKRLAVALPVSMYEDMCCGIISAREVLQRLAALTQEDAMPGVSGV